jgi:hypothetical protein
MGVSPTRLPTDTMYILYVDDAGSAGNHEEKHFVLGGIALFERHIEPLEYAMEAIAAGTGLPDPATLEFHGNQILPGTKRWRGLRDQEQRRSLIVQVLDATAALQGYWALFGVVVNKAAVSPRDPAEYAFEQLCSRFDQFLARIKRDGQAQRGLIVLDRSTRETRLQELATTFRRQGHSWGRLRNIVDVPFFVDSRATRAIQYADLVTYALWRKFERGDPAFLAAIRHKFDSHGGVVHGLLHERWAEATCDCPYCLSRRGVKV